MTPATLHPRATALLVIDMQIALLEREHAGDRRNNPQALPNIERLLHACRQTHLHVIHVRHTDRNPASRFRIEKPGFSPIPETREHEGETVLVKRVNSAFIDTDLEPRLRTAAITTLLLCGAVTNGCVESTARTAGNMGFDTRVVHDATWTFDHTGPDGTRYPAELVHAMSIANLHEEFATIVTTDDVLRALEVRDPDREVAEREAAGR